MLGITMKLDILVRLTPQVIQNMKKLDQISYMLTKTIQR